MARVLKTNAELEQVQKLIQESPLFIDIKTSITIATNGLNSDADFTVHAFPWPKIECLIMVVRNEFCLPLVICKMLREDGNFDDTFKQYVENVFENLTEFNEIALYSTEDLIKNQITTILSPSYNFTPTMPSYTYIMTEEIQQQVAKMDIQLPEGFHFCDLNPENDSKFISSLWKHAGDTDVLNTKSKIANLPSIGIKFGDKLVAFEMCFSSGAMNHLYSDPEFRGKGLGTAVELKLSQKLIALNITPHKFVEIDSPLALAFAEKSKYFTKVLNGTSGQPVLYDVRHLTKINS